MISIERELKWWHKELEKQGKLIEAQRLWQRTMFDLEMIRQIGYCHGIENYSRHFSGRLPGEAPPTLLDYLPPDAILMFSTRATRPCRSSAACITATARARRRWCNYGFRLPSALDNRPLTFEEFENRVNQIGLRLGDPRARTS